MRTQTMNVDIHGMNGELITIRPTGGKIISGSMVMLAHTRFSKSQSMTLIMQMLEASKQEMNLKLEFNFCGMTVRTRIIL